MEKNGKISDGEVLFRGLGDGFDGGGNNCESLNLFKECTSCKKTPFIRSSG